MKKTTEKATGAAKQKSDSRKVPLTSNKTGRTQKTPADERNEPSFMSDGDARPESSAAGSDADPRGADVTAEAAENAEGGFHPPTTETRRERHTHDKGEVEAASMSFKSRVPPVHKPGDPGSAPRIQQRRSVYERGNRYPLTHAPKA